MNKDNISNYRNRRGYIYLIQESHGLYKIGYARDINQRIGSMQSGNPFPLVLIAHVEVRNMVDAERFIHSELKAYHVVREWYSMPDLDPWRRVLNSYNMRQWTVTYKIA